MKRIVPDNSSSDVSISFKYNDDSSDDDTTFTNLDAQRFMMQTSSTSSRTDDETTLTNLDAQRLMMQLSPTSSYFQTGETIQKYTRDNNYCFGKINSLIDGSAMWPSMREPVYCFKLLTPGGIHSTFDKQSKTYRPSSDRASNSLYYSQAMVLRRNGEMVTLTAKDSDAFSKIPEEVFVNHLCEVFYWPFRPAWQCFILIVLTIIIELISYHLLFDPRATYIKNINESGQFYMELIIVQFIYLIDSMLTLVHKQWPEFEMKDTTISRPKKYLVMDFLVMAPTVLSAYLLEEYKYLAHTIQLLAAYKFFLYSAHLNRQIHSSCVRIIFLSFLILNLIMLLLNNTVYGYTCFPDEEEDIWICGKSYFFDSFLQVTYLEEPLSYGMLYQLSSLQASFLLPPLSQAEHFEDGNNFIRLVYIIVMIVIGLLSYLYIVPLLVERKFINDFLKTTFCLKRYKVVSFLTESECTDISSEKIDQFCTYAWKKQKGLLVDSVDRDYPPELLLSIKHDIYHPALAHSSLLADQEQPYLRALASRMTSQLLMEGDVILRRNNMLSKMIYVAEGSIQILTTEDDTTPLLVLGVGSCIGEASLITSFKSQCFVCCHSTTCEIHVLSKIEFIEVSKRYKSNYQAITTAVEKRYKNAVQLDMLKGLIKIKVNKTLRLNELLTSSTDWLKYQMQKGVEMQADLKSEIYTLSGIDDWYIHANHTTRFIDHLAVPQVGYDSLADPVLLKLTFPFIFQPDSRVHHFWDKLMLLSVTFLALYLPYSFSFSCEYTHFMVYYPVFYQAIYVFDILLQVTTSVPSKDGLLIENSDIIYQRIQKPLFIVDIIATLPLHFLSYVFPSSKENLKPMLQLNQLLKIYRIVGYVDRWWTIQTKYQYFVRCLLKYIVYLAYIIYLSACIVMVVVCGNDCRCLVNQVRNLDLDLDEGNVLSLLLIGYYRVGVYYFGSLSLSVLPVVPTELKFIRGITYLMYFYNLYVMSSLIAIISNNEDIRSRKIENIESLRLMLGYANTRHEQVKSYFKCGYQEKLDIFHPGMPPSLEMILKCNVFMSVVFESPIFLGLPRDVVMSVANECELASFPANHVVMMQHYPSKFMMFVKNGILKVICNGVEVKKRLKCGDCAGVFEVCMGIPYKNTVVSETDVEVVVITGERFKYGLLTDNYSAIPLNKILNSTFYKSLAHHEQRIRSDVSLPVLDFFQKSLTPTNDMENPESADKPTKSNLRKRPNCFRRLYKFIISKTTIHPNSKVIHRLEMAHVLLAVVAFIYYPMKPVLVNCISDKLALVNYVLIGFGIVQIYLRTLIDYYDPNTGLLVTGHVKIFRYYLAHSMCLDIFSILPLDLISTGNQLLDLLLTYNRLLQFYHSILSMRYFRKKLHKYKIRLLFIQFSSITVLFSIALGSIVLVSGCEFGENINPYDNSLWSSCFRCREDCWLSVMAKSVSWNKEALPISGMTSFIYAVYFVSSVTMCNALQNIIPKNISELLIAVLGPFLSMFGLYYFTSEAVKYLMRKNYARCQFNFKFERLLHFYKDLKIPDKLVKLTKDHINSVWKYNRGLDLIEIAKLMNGSSKTEVFFQIFLPSLLKNKVLMKKAPYIFFDKLFDTMNIKFYTTKCYIILSGDISKDIFFISKGFVHIFDSNKRYVGTAGPGSIFGTLSNVPWSHQRFSFMAASFVEVLIVPSLDVHRKILSYAPKLKPYFSEARKFDLIVQVPKNEQQYYEAQKEKEEEKKKRGKGWFSCDKIAKHLPSRHSSNVRSTRPSQNLFRTWILMIIILYYTSVNLTIYSFIINDFSSQFLVVYYIIDVLKLLTIFMRLYAPAPSFETQLPYLINTRLSILFDIFISLPFDLLALLFDFDSILVSALRINRIFALCFVYGHWTKICSVLMQEILPSRFSKILIAVVLLPSATVYIISLSTLVYAFWNLQENYDFNGDKLRYLKCVAFVMSMHLPNRIQSEDFFPKSTSMLLTHIFVQSFTPLLTALFLGYVFVSTRCNRLSFGEYITRSLKFKRYIKSQHVANALQFKVKATIELNWYKYKDCTLPELFLSLPLHIQAAVKNHAFGKLVSTNFVFNGCNKAFLRQVVSCLQILWLHPGDKIVKKHSLNGRMFFVYEGYVAVNDSDGMIHDILVPGEAFGLAQGIDPLKEHPFNYIAHSCCVVIYLDYNHWSHLQQFHPISMRIVRRRINRVNRKFERKFLN